MLNVVLDPPFAIADQGMHLVISDAGKLNIEIETGHSIRQVKALADAGIDVVPEEPEEAEQGLTLSDYIAGLIAADLGSWIPRPNAPAIIPIQVDLPTDHEGTYIGEAVAERMKQTEHAE